MTILQNRKREEKITQKLTPTLSTPLYKPIQIKSLAIENRALIFQERLGNRSAPQFMIRFKVDQLSRGRGGSLPRAICVCYKSMFSSDSAASFFCLTLLHSSMCGLLTKSKISDSVKNMPIFEFSVKFASR